MEITPIGNISTNQLDTIHGRKEIMARKASKDFEAVMLSQSFNEMMKGVKGPKTAGASQTDEMWRSVLTDEIAKSVVSKGGIGIAEKVYKDIMKWENR